MDASPPGTRAALAGLSWRVAFALVLVAASWWPGLDVFAEAQVEAALTRALIAFAIARGLNGVISVAQGTEVAVQPAGVGVNFAPGEVLDPINDLIEQFSTVMLMASASLGLQRLLIGISSWAPLAILISAVAVAWLLAWWQSARPQTPQEPPRPGSRLTPLLQGCLMVLLALRFAVPFTALASEGAYRIFLAPEYERSSAALDLAKERIGAASKDLQSGAPPPEGLLDRARDWIGRTAENLDVEARLDALQKTAAEATRNVVNLIAIFVVQTVFFPLLFSWLAYLGFTRMLPRAWSAPTRSPQHLR